ncbi:MAG: acyl-CoA dehydrogenase family protein [Pseudomonadota bacterium]
MLHEVTPSDKRPKMDRAALIAKARELGETRFAERAAIYDAEGRFPTENYADLRQAGFLGLVIPTEYGGLGADYETYCHVSAEMARWCGATALTFNMHCATLLWSSRAIDDLPMSDEDRAMQHENRAGIYREVIEEGVIFAQPFSEPNTAAAAGKAPFGTTARKVDGGWIVNGMKHFASLSGAAQYYSMVCSVDDGANALDVKNSVYLAVPAAAEGFEIFGDWNPVGMQATMSRNLRMKEVFVPDALQLMPVGVYHQVAYNWPHMFFTLSPTYMGIAQAAFDFTVQYLRGEVPGVKADMRAVPEKQFALAKMRLMLEAARALFEKTTAQAKANPTQDERLTAYAAQHTIMENCNAIASLALRTCGGRTLLKTFPLERLYRESRCGALMLPWTAEILERRLGQESLYRPGEKG